MIITLSDAFSRLSTDELRSYQHSIQNLISAHGQGWHIFVPDRATIDAIMESIALSATQRIILQHYIKGRHADLMGQARSVKKFICCTPREDQELPVDARQISVNLDRFEDLECCMKSELLVENATRDGVFYVAIAKMLGGVGSSRLPLQFRTQNGGGDTLADELERHAGECPPRLAVVDSDRKRPGGSLGGTASRAISTFNGLNDPLISLMITSGRSVENYLPPEVMLEAVKDDADSISRLQTMISIRASERQDDIRPSHSITRHISLKKGVKFGDFRSSTGIFRGNFQNYIEANGGSCDLADIRDTSKDDVQVVGKCGTRCIEKVIKLIIVDEPGFERLMLAHLPEYDADLSLKSLVDEIVAFGIGGRRIAGSELIAVEAA